MTTIRWKSGAAPVAQVQAYLFGGTWETTDVVNLVVGNKTLSVVTGSTVIATLIDTIVTAFNALSATYYPEFAAITASRSTSTLLLTADDLGVPFSCTVSTTETGGGAADAQTIDGTTSSAGTASTACSGPNHWDTAANWDTGVVPVTGDTVIFENSEASVKWGLAQSAVTLAELRINASYTGAIGLPEVNTEGTEAFVEYRATYLAIGATLLNVGRGDGQGSGRLKVNVGTAQVALDVQGTGSGLESDLPALIFKGTHASNAANIASGSVGLAVYGGEVATVLTLRVSGDAEVLGGAGLTLTTLNMVGNASVTLFAGLTTVLKKGGTLVLWADNVTTLTDYRGTTYILGTSTIATLNDGHEATVLFNPEDLSKGTLAAATVTNANFYKGCTMADGYGRVTWTNPFATVGCHLNDCNLDFGPGRNYAVT